MLVAHPGAVGLEVAWGLVPFPGVDAGQGEMRVAMASVVVGVEFVVRDGELAGVPGVCAAW